MSAVLLDARGLNKRFGGITALKGLDVRQSVGETLGMIGPNGSGKSTFVNAVTGQMPLDSGALLFAGQEIRGLKPSQMAHIGLVRTFQSVRVFGKRPVRENLRTAQLACGLDPAEEADHMASIVEWLALEDRLDQDAGDLTLFEQRRLELAMRLALHPRLIMLDEPVAGLSAQEIRAMMKVLLALKGRTTLFVIEHTMRVIRELADRVVVLVTGEKIADGSPGHVLKDARVIRQYLGTHHA